ncbi:DUF4307 domain-containing protein [Oryzihumus sp.]
MPLPRPAPGTTRWWVIGTIWCAVGIAIAVWLGLASTVGQVSWTDIGYHVVDDSRVDVSYDVHRPTGKAVTCQVQALDSHFGTVGSVAVHIPAPGPDSVHRETTVRTTSRAVTGVVQTCSVDGAP